MAHTQKYIQIHPDTHTNTQHTITHTHIQIHTTTHVGKGERSNLTKSEPIKKCLILLELNQERVECL